MPKLWDETVESHRRAVREAVEDAAWLLASEQGLRSVTMAKVAAAAGIARATIYKYFPDVETILAAWHQRQIEAHLEQLTAMSEAADDPESVLRSVLAAYAEIVARRGQHGPDLVALLHHGGAHGTRDHLLDELLVRVLTAAVAAGRARADIDVDTLAAFCRHALGAAAGLHSADGIDRLVELTFAALSPSDRRPTSAEHHGRT